MADLIGKELGDFKILKLISDGAGMSTVYKASQPMR